MTFSLDDVPAPAFAVAADSVIVDANERAADLVGASRDDLRGRRVDSVLPGWKPSASSVRTFSIGGRTLVAVEDPARSGDERLLVLVDVSELETAREDAAEMARSRSTFLAKLSHEIRSAVASMTGFAEMLEDEVTASNREMASIIALSGRHLMDTLDAVMDLARIEFGEKEVELSDVELVARVRDRVTILRADAERKGLDLTFEPAHDELYGRLNPVFLDRIVHNLVDNAIKYTDEGKIEVDVEERDGRIWLYVADTGRGMNAAFIPKLFSPFEREARAGGEPSGSGLGLAVTRYLVELMHGQIFACSTAGEGSTFTVSFPEPAEV